MTEKLFWIDPYLSEIQTQVESVSGSVITLKETILYAQSGGQESDEGIIGGYPVLQAEKYLKTIHYILPDKHELKVGDSVAVKIDWDRRYRLMRLHFAAELILELIYRQLKGVEKIGAHISQDKARVDFLWGENLAGQLESLANSARRIVEQDIPVISAFADESNQRRYWKIPGFAKVPCGGTHLRRTSEVGKFRLKRKNIGRGKERIEVYLSDDRSPTSVLTSPRNSR